MKRFTVAGVQVALAEPNNIERNEKKALSWVPKAIKECGAELIVYPETCNTGFETGLTADRLWDLVDSIPGKTTLAAQRAAREHGVYIVWNTYERGAKRGTVFNSSVLIGRNGDIIGVYRKTHPFPVERVEGGGWCTAGDAAEPFDTDLARIGLMICYDGDFPDLSTTYALKGAEVIVRSSALLRTYDHWYAMNFARAYENHVYLVGVNAVGSDAAGNFYFGHSQVISPNGWRLAQARCAEEVVYAELSPDPIKH
ncbi:MAG: carbon-nitrogen hydrolase family protein, partial [Candidatus Methanomethylicia archaeon]|nr:carbon-nitrogen hydrolase family protein [Candidatus Methanomethylicia archaeon]